MLLSSLSLGEEQRKTRAIRAPALLMCAILLRAGAGSGGGAVSWPTLLPLDDVHKAFPAREGTLCRTLPVLI